MKIARTTYLILAAGAFLAFLGHGLWGLVPNEKFPELVIGTADTFGITVAQDTAVSLVNVIGVVDLTIAAVILGLIAVGYGKATTLALIVFSWAAAWGFLTALSRPLHELGEPYEWFDLIERGPNFLLPIALVYLVVKARKSSGYVTGY